MLSQINFKLAAWTYWISKCTIMQWGRVGFCLSRSQGCSNYHKEMQAFLWMGVISLLSKKPLIHFKLAAYRLHVWISKCIIMKGGGLGVSLSRWQDCSNYNTEMLAFLDGALLYFRQIANNLWFISNLQYGLKQHLTASPCCEEDQTPLS